MAAIAIPGFTSMAQGERRVAEVNDLVLALNYARSEAVKQDSTAGVNVLGQRHLGWRLVGVLHEYRRHGHQYHPA